GAYVGDDVGDEPDCAPEHEKGSGVGVGVGPIDPVARRPDLGQSPLGVLPAEAHRSSFKAAPKKASARGQLSAQAAAFASAVPPIIGLGVPMVRAIMPSGAPTNTACPAPG